MAHPLAGGNHCPHRRGHAEYYDYLWDVVHLGAWLWWFRCCPATWTCKHIMLAVKVAFGTGSRRAPSAIIVGCWAWYFRDRTLPLRGVFDR
jgi:hypothetical protein